VESHLPLLQAGTTDTSGIAYNFLPQTGAYRCNIDEIIGRAAPQAAPPTVEAVDPWL